MRKYIVFAVVAIPVFLGQVGVTSVAVAFPTMVSSFGTSLVLAGWVLSIYQLVLISAIPVVGRLSDTLGRRSTFMACLVCFTIGSILCSLAPSMGWLIVSRAIQATGGGGFIAAASGIVSDEFPGARQRFIGLFSSVIPLGAIVGPNVGGLMVEALGWQSVFWINIPLALIALVLTRRLVKADVKKASRRELDFISVGLMTASVSAVMIALTLSGKAYHMPLIITISVTLVGVLLISAFVYRTKNSPGAVISIDMLTRRHFLATNIYNFAYGACAQSGIASLLPLYAASVYGMSAFESGVMITPRSLGMMVASIIASFSIMKWGYRRPLIFGSLGVALGMIVLSLELGGTTLGGVSLTPAMIMIIFVLILGYGAGTASPAASNAGIELMPDKVATIVGLRQIFRQMGGAISIAIGTLVLESSPSTAQGFKVVFLGCGLAMLAALPAVFFMPSSPTSQGVHREKATGPLPSPTGGAGQAVK